MRPVGDGVVPNPKFLRYPPPGCHPIGKRPVLLVSDRTQQVGVRVAKPGDDVIARAERLGWVLGVLVGQRVDAYLGIRVLDGVGHLVEEVQERSRLGPSRGEGD